MPFYLQMDGVDDRIVVPYGIPVDEIIMDVKIISKANYAKYLNGYFQWHGGKYEQWISPYTKVFTDGVEKVNGTDFIPLNQRVLIRVLRTPGTTGGGTEVIFANNTAGSGALNGIIYSVRYLSAGVTTAYYDMTKGNVQDQSGNGRHATLVGGTFVDDGTSAGTVQSGQSTISGATTTSASAQAIRQSNAAMNASSLAYADGVPIRLTSGAISGVGVLSASATVGSQVLAQALIAGKAQVSPTAIPVKIGVASVAGVSNVNSAPNKLAQGFGAISGQSAVSISVGNQSLASAIIGGLSGVSTSAIRQAIGDANYAGKADVNAQGVRILLSDSGIDVDGDIRTQAQRLLNGAADLAGISGASAGGIRILASPAQVSGSSAVSVFIGNRYVQLIPIAVNINRGEVIMANINRISEHLAEIKRKEALQVRI